VTWDETIRRMATPRFWSDYHGTTSIFDDGARRPLPTTTQLPIDVGDGGALELEIDGWLTFSALRIGGEWLGRDGGDEQYPPYPDALRCIELDLIGRAAAIHRGFDHPGPIAGLLAKYAPVVDERDAQVWLPMLEAAWCGLGVEVPTGVMRFWDGGVMPAIDHRAANFRWRAIDGGYVVDQPQHHGGVSLASLRVEGFARVYRGIDPAEAVDGYPELDGMMFPHGRLATVLASARKTCDAAIPTERRGEAVALLARDAAAGDGDAYDVLADALDGCAPAVVRALRRRDPWAAEVAAGVEPWILLG
jgi:hypothetical protein